ncbi:MAG: PAS domain S-box protein, partial [Flammeovirgaceae bacterium]|nr:PAS domain S-box protein [Flammeovirgaceae bacterium]MDW8288534.1 PAS domain S-box protein [Flammeovirgaceae bacterium]
MYQLKRYDGEYRWVLEKGTPYTDDIGKFKGFISSTVDITERKIKEEKRSQEKVTEYSENKLKEGLEYSHFIAIMVDNQQKIKYANQQTFKLTGWSYEEIIERPLFDIFEHNYTTWTPDLIDTLMSTFEGKIFTKEGKHIPIRCNTITLNNPDGTLASMTIVGEDISAEIEMDKQLRETNQNLQDLLDTSHDLIGIFDADGHLLFLNSAFEQTLEYTWSEIANKNFLELVEEDYREHTRRALDKVSELNQRMPFTTVFLSKTGKKVIVEGSLSCHQEKGKPHNYKIIVADITEKLRAERAQNLHYKISKLIETGTPLKDLFHKFYLHLNQALPIDSFLIALKNEEGEIYFPFYVNSSAIPQHEGEIHGKGFAAYSMSLDRPMFLYGDIIRKICHNHQIQEELPKVWMGVPLILENRSLGIMVAQSFRNKKDFNKRDLELLVFVSGQVASAVMRFQNEQKISNQSARLEAIFESGTHAMWTVGKDYRLTRFNQNFTSKC